MTNKRKRILKVVAQLTQVSDSVSKEWGFMELKYYKTAPSNSSELHRLRKRYLVLNGR